jgi:enoyl-CoA hydratase/carnithine racemase
LIEVRRDGQVLQVTLNRPEKRNALNTALCHELVEAFDRASEDPDVNAVLLAANGPAFCAGMDLRESLETDPAQLAALHERLFTTIHRIRKPIIAAVHGAALAGGTGLAANAHIVVAAPDSRFGLTEIRIGLWPVLVFRAVALAVGERRATELSLTGRIFGAQEAREYGLVSEIADHPLDRAGEIAAAVAGFSSFAVSEGLGYVGEIRGKDWGEAGQIGARVRERLMASREFADNVRAFLGKKT